MRRLLLISFDAVGDVFFDRMMARPNFRALAKRAAVRRGVDSVFVTNTYPVHTSVVTGVPPGVHGLTSNTEPFPVRHAKWRYESKEIQAKTIWQMAAARGRKVAAVLWPVTGGAKEIRWNIPELLVQPGENQIRMNLQYGSKLIQLREVLKHRALMKDFFFVWRTSCERKSPGLHWCISLYLIRFATTMVLMTHRSWMRPWTYWT